MSNPCGDCGLDCIDLCVFCEQCEAWYHSKCQKLSKDQLRVLTKCKNIDFVCSRCCRTSDCSFDYNLSLSRLEKYAANNKLLTKAVQVETILLRGEPLTRIRNETDFTYTAQSALTEDKVSRHILNEHNMLINDRKPVSVSSDGNCLFNSLSVDVTGNEHLASRIRVLTCIELVSNKSKYETRLNDRLSIVTESYDESCLKAAKNRSFSSAWTILASATVMGCPIQSVYPPINGFMDKAIGILNTVFEPLQGKAKEPIVICWTGSCIASNKTGTWTPDHFVPLVKPSADISIIDIESTEEFPPLNSTANDSHLVCPTIFDTTALSMHEASCLNNSHDSYNKLGDQSEVNDLQSGTNSSDLDNPMHTLSTHETETAESCRKLENNKSLSLDRIIDTLVNENATHDDIPRIVKDNVYFVLDHTKNINRKTKSKKMEFWDDCGTWDTKTTSTKTTYYVRKQDGTLQSCVKKNGLFCKEIKREFVPLEPQPDDSNIFVLKRYYASLKRDNMYKKRISWFDKMPGYSIDTMNKAVAEYLGTYPIENINRHGNARITKQEYIRTSPETKNKVKTEIEAGKSVKQIFTDNFSSEHQPRDSKSIQNLKYSMKKSSDPSHRQNVADDMQTVINMNSAKHPFLKEIVQTSGKPPNIICYTDFQMKHFANACRSSIIGVDRTFNLGACFVTTTVFQEHKLKRKGKGMSPIIMGPIYLHWDGAFHTYQRFFTHIASMLDISITDTLLSVNNIVIGSDEERAIVKAIKSSFPDSDLTLCTRHLSENVSRHLKNKVGVNERESKKILTDLFGDNGLIESNTTVDFTSQATDIERKYEDIVGPYLTNKVIPTIKEYVYKARKGDSRIPLQWKNNNCESMNHILKLNQDWKPEKLPELVNKIHKEIQLQESLIVGALYAHGDYELNTQVSHLQYTKSLWQSKSEKERALVLQKFLSHGSKAIDKGTVTTSTDGGLVIPKTNACARKPGQRKRARSAKTMSAKKVKFQ